MLVYTRGDPRRSLQRSLTCSLARLRSLALAFDEEASCVDLRPGFFYKHSILSNKLLLNRANLLFSGKKVGVQFCALRQRKHH